MTNNNKIATPSRTHRNRSLIGAKDNLHLLNRIAIFPPIVAKYIKRIERDLVMVVIVVYIH